MTTSGSSRPMSSLVMRSPVMPEGGGLRLRVEAREPAARFQMDRGLVERRGAGRAEQEQQDGRRRRQERGRDELSRHGVPPGSCAAGIPVCHWPAMARYEYDETDEGNFSMRRDGAPPPGADERSVARASRATGSGAARRRGPRARSRRGDLPHRSPRHRGRSPVAAAAPRARAPDGRRGRSRGPGLPPLPARRPRRHRVASLDVRRVRVLPEPARRTSARRPATPATTRTGGTRSSPSCPRPSRTRSRRRSRTRRPRRSSARGSSGTALSGGPS